MDTAEATCGEWFDQAPAFKASPQRHVMEETVRRDQGIKERNT